MEKIEEELDTVFSIYTRMRFADWKGDVHCFTCPWFGRWQDCDAGHWIPRGNFAVRWDDDNGRPQCRSCNRAKDGRVDIFEEELLWTIGDDGVAKLRERAKRTRMLDQEGKEKLLFHLQAMVKAIRTGHNVRERLPNDSFST